MSIAMNINGWLMLSLFFLTGLNNIWLNQATTQSRNVVVGKIEVILKDKYMQYWYNDVLTSDKCLNYRLYKDSHGYEQYLGMCQVIVVFNNSFIFVFAIIVYQLKREAG